MAHSFVLFSRSPVFEASFSSSFLVQHVTRDGKQYQKIVIDDIEPGSFNVLLKFLYTNELDAITENIMGALHAGRFLY